MSLSVLLKCDGHRAQQPCRAYRSSSLGYNAASATTRFDDLALSAAALPGDDWRTLPDGGDLCPSLGHDEDPPEQVLIDPDPRARHVPGIGRVVEPPITGRP